jgi:HEAT repeat protein
MRISEIPSIAVVLALRDEFVSDILRHAISHPVVQQLEHLHNLTRKDAEAYIVSGLEQFGVRFSTVLIRTLLDRLSEVDDLIHPLLLNCCCWPLASLSANRKRAATVRDLDTMGSLAGMIGNYVKSQCQRLGGRFNDSMYVLGVLGEETKGGAYASARDLSARLPGFAIRGLVRLLDDLCGLRIVEKSLEGKYRVAHEALIEGVQGRERSGDFQQFVKGFENWCSSGVLPPVWRARELLEAVIAAGAPPTHYLIFAGCLAFATESTEFNATLATWLKDRTPERISEFCRQFGKGGGGAQPLSAEICSVLFLSDGPECFRFGVSGMDAAARGVWSTRIWLTEAYLRAMMVASRAQWNEFVASEGFASLSSPALRLVIRCCIAKGVDLGSSFLRCALTSSDEGLRAEALHALRKCDVPHLYDLVVAALASDSALIRGAAIAAYSLSRSENVLSVVRGGVRDASPLVRRRAVMACSVLDSTTAMAVLKQTLEQEFDPAVREACMDVIGRCFGASFLPMIFIGLEDEADIVREAALYALVHVIGPEDAIPHVRPLVQDTSVIVREAAIRAIGMTQSAVECEVVGGQLRDASPSLRSCILTAMMGVASENLDSMLLRISCFDNWTAENIGKLLRLIGRPGLLSGLRIIDSLPLRHASDFEVASQVLTALQTISDPSCVSRIRSYVFHPSSDVRSRAILALAQIGGDEACKLLCYALSDPTDEIVNYAIYALARQGCARAKSDVESLAVRSESMAAAVEYFKKHVS